MEKKLLERSCVLINPRGLSTAGMQRAYLRSQHLTRSLPGAPQGPCGTLLVLYKYLEREPPAQQLFFGWKPEGSKDMLSPLRLSVAKARIRSSWSIFYSMVFSYLWLLLIANSLIFSPQDVKKLVSSSLFRSCKWSTCWHILINFCYFSLGQW